MPKDGAVTIKFVDGPGKNEVSANLSYENATAQMAWEGLKVYLNFIDEVAKKTLTAAETDVIRDGTNAMRLCFLGAEACINTLSSKEGWSGAPESIVARMIPWAFLRKSLVSLQPRISRRF